LADLNDEEQTFGPPTLALVAPLAPASTLGGPRAPWHRQREQAPTALVLGGLAGCGSPGGLDPSPKAARSLMLRAALVIGLAAAFTSAAALGLGLSGSSVAFGAVIAALVVRPDFSRWPAAFYPVLLVMVAIGLTIGTCLGRALASVPQVFVFGLVAALMQVLTLLLPSKLRSLSVVLAVFGVLPLLSSNPSWSSARDELLAIALGLAIGTALQILFTPHTPSPVPQKKPTPPEPAVAYNPMAGLRSPFFWRKLICASLALAIGEGLGAVEPKYVYFGVVLLLNDSIGDTLFKVRDRMVGVSLGILMPLLVFNTIGGGSFSNGLVMGGTAALAMALNQTPHLNTALISSGVAFIGYGPLVTWYIPNRWIGYSLGCALSMVIAILIFPSSSLKRYNELKALPDTTPEQLLELLPGAREEALLLGLQPPTAAEKR
jgi:hypothetical protein